jgi:hypothetical protein
MFPSIFYTMLHTNVLYTRMFQHKGCWKSVIIKLLTVQKICFGFVTSEVESVEYLLIKNLRNNFNSDTTTLPLILPSLKFACGISCCVFYIIYRNCSDMLDSFYIERV